MSERVGAPTYLGVAVGGAMGAALRVLLSSGEFGSLLLVNGLGCFAIGLIWRFSEPGRRRLLPPRWSIALISGLCGALTSFSTAVILVLEQLGTLAVGTVLQMTGGSVGCWMLATFGGLALGSVLNPAASRRDTPDIDTMSE